MYTTGDPRKLGTETVHGYHIEGAEVTSVGRVVINYKRASVLSLKRFGAEALRKASGAGSLVFLNPHTLISLVPCSPLGFQYMLHSFIYFQHKTKKYMVLCISNTSPTGASTA